MSEQQFLWAILAMAGVMILFRIIPLLFFKKKIQNRFIQSFLAYVPCAVLTSMAFPEVFYKGASNFWAAVGGVAVAVVLAYFERSLIVVAVSSAAAVFIIEQILHMTNVM